MAHLPPEGDRSDAELAYLRQLGLRLRAVRRRRGLSLKMVEASSRGEFKASALGAYERAQRTISISRLHRLARLYGVTVDDLLPSEDGGQAGGHDLVIDLRDLEARRDDQAGLAALRQAVERLLTSR